MRVWGGVDEMVGSLVCCTLVCIYVSYGVVGIRRVRGLPVYGVDRKRIMGVYQISRFGFGEGRRRVSPIDIDVIGGVLYCVGVGVDVWCVPFAVCRLSSSCVVLWRWRWEGWDHHWSLALTRYCHHQILYGGWHTKGGSVAGRIYIAQWACNIVLQ